jgi:putative ABC transport system ATP-binding protein
VARAITGRPAILLADEPTGNLDSKSGESLMQLFSELHASGATVCVVTHDPRWLTQAQRHIYLFDGATAESAIE